jgi:site-specific DNA recombinase
VKTAAIYSRVSTADQVKGTSLDGQVALCQAYAKEHGYSVLKVVQEDASGARLDRPKLGELRNMADRREIEALIVFDPDRLSRSMAHTMMLMEEFERNKADVLFVNAPQEDTPEGEMLFGMRALFAQYERTKILERTRRGKERRVREGQVMMSARSCPFGYSYTPVIHKLEVIESEAAWVVKMFEWMVYEGCSLREIGRRLDSNCVMPKGGADHWYPAVIRGMLSNEIYAGTWHYGKRTVVEPSNPAKRKTQNPKNPKSSRERRPRAEWLSVDAPAIVPQSLYDAIQERLEHNRAMSPRNSKYQYLLRGLIVCSRCGHKMYGNSKNPNSPGGPRMVYSCSGRYRNHNHLPIAERCNQKCLRGQRLETLTWAEVVRQLSDEKELRKILEERETELKRGRKDDEAELEILIGLEAGLKRQANKDLDLYDSDIIDKETLRERMTVIREKQEALARSKAEVTARLVKWEQSPASEERIAELVAIAKDGLPDCTFEEKRRFLEGMNVKILADGDQVTITGLITDRTLSLASKREQPAAIDGVLCHSYHGRPPMALL